MSGLTFDPVRHRYQLDGKDIPGMTTVLADMGMVNYQFAQPQHADRGTASHELCAEIALLERPESEYEWDGACGCGQGPDCKHAVSLPYGRSYQSYIKNTGFVVEPSLIEFQVFTRTLWCAGTVDQVGWRGKSRILLDLKSGEPQPAAEIQLAGYRYMLRECRGIEVDVAYCLWLDRDGKFPKVVEPKDPAADERIFMSLMEVWHWRRANGMLPWKGKNDHRDSG